VSGQAAKAVSHLERQDSSGPVPDSDVVIRITDVSKRYAIYERPQHRLWQGLFRGRRQFYRDFWALRGISFEVRRGETIGIIGRNGSGKSTLLQIICGILTPTSGSVQVSGRIGALLELGSGFNPEFTGRENVYLNASILGLTAEQIDARFDQIAAFADIGTFIDQPVKTYSSGMTVRLAFAVVAHVDADLLVIDEALAVGDAVFTQKCMRFLRGFQERGTILFVTHDTGAVLNLCQRALWMRDGLCAMNGQAKPVVEAYLRSNLETAQLLEAAEEPDAGVDHADAAPELDIADSSSAAAPAPLAEGSSFGAGGARIRSVALLDRAGRTRPSVAGGERVTLRIVVEAVTDLDSAIVGFHLKDRLGQILFGENTCETTAGAPVAIRAGESAVARFSFPMPHLISGKYTLDVAVADGTHYQHVHHHWFFDLLTIEVVTNRPVAGVFAAADLEVTFSRS
jgi:lipopolysaccharide transport system ATP-binding protein